MTLIEILVIIISSIVVIGVIILQIYKHYKKQNSCSSDCGCSQIEDMKRALKSAHNAIKQDDKAEK